jgi:hypothetical protein
MEMNARGSVGAAVLLVVFAQAAAPAVGRAGDGAFDLPADEDAVVVRLVENNGPLSPEFQEGYEIGITAGGEATYTITPAGANPDLGDDALDQVVLEAELSEDDLVDLLDELDDRGYFELAEDADTEDDLPVGGSVTLLAVTLDDDEWSLYADGLTDDENRQLSDAQQAVVAAVLTALGEAAADDEAFDLPDEDEIVVAAIVDNGPVAPEYQTGYSIRIEASGRVEVEFTPEGASPDAAEPTGEPERWRYDLDDEGLQGLLVVLDELGFFDLPPADESEMPDGGDVDFLRVSLADEEWEINAYGLDEEEAARFAAIQTAVAVAAGVDHFPIPLF